MGSKDEVSKCLVDIVRVKYRSSFLESPIVDNFRLNRGSIGYFVRSDLRQSSTEKQIEIKDTFIKL